MRHFDKEKSLDNLVELTTILKNYDVKHWLQDGTLLGFYRENDLISHDKDTDLGLFWEDIKDKKYVIKEILNKGYRIFKIKGYKEDSLMLTFIKNNQTTDFFFYYNTKNKIYHCAPGKKYQVYKFHYDPFDIKEIIFLGYKFFVPEDELKFIETKYGKDWQIPKTKSKWKNVKSPLNATPTNIFLDIKNCKKDFRTWLKK